MDLCELELNDGVACGRPAYNTLRVRDRVTNLTTTVKVCDGHKKDHDRKAAITRFKSKKK